MKTGSPLTVAVTGATGYIGRHLCAALVSAGKVTLPLVRRTRDGSSGVFTGAEPPRNTGDLAGHPDWAALLSGVHMVVHTAALAHSDNAEVLPVDRVRRVNTDAAIELAEGAAAAGVSRFVFVSSVGVYGPIPSDCPATEDTPCRPADPYAVSKREAELGLAADAFAGRMQIAVVRAPMVYGPHCPGNLRKLAALVRLGLPIPFQALDGRRNLVGIDSLCEAIVRIVSAEGDVSGTWNIAEPDELSVPAIIEALGEGMLGKPGKLLRVPVRLLTLAAALVGRAELVRKLDAPVLIDGTRFRERFNWDAARPTREGIVLAGRSFVTPGSRADRAFVE